MAGEGTAVPGQPSGGIPRSSAAGVRMRERVEETRSKTNDSRIPWARSIGKSGHEYSWDQDSSMFLLLLWITLVYSVQQMLGTWKYGVTVACGRSGTGRLGLPGFL